MVLAFFDIFMSEKMQWLTYPFVLDLRILNWERRYI